jgi:hypothetical protein
MARTTHRSRSGTKLYAKRNASGQFDDIQTYKRAHASDIKRSSAAERGTGKTAGKKKTTKAKAGKKKRAVKAKTARRAAKKK